MISTHNQLKLNNVSLDLERHCRALAQQDVEANLHIIELALVAIENTCQDEVIDKLFEAFAHVQHTDKTTERQLPRA